MTRLSQEKEEINGKYQSLKMEYSLLKQDLDDAKQMNKSLMETLNHTKQSKEQHPVNDTVKSFSINETTENTEINDRSTIFSQVEPLTSRFFAEDVRKHEELQKKFDDLMDEKRIMQETILALTRMLENKENIHVDQSKGKEDLAVTDL
jgi:chromosome segregation ATPase